MDDNVKELKNFKNLRKLREVYEDLIDVLAATKLYYNRIEKIGKKYNITAKWLRLILEFRENLAQEIVNVRTRMERMDK